MARKRGRQWTRSGSEKRDPRGGTPQREGLKRGGGERMEGRGQQKSSK